MLDQLRRFDGKQTGVLIELAESLEPCREDFLELTAIASSDEPRLQTAATWVIKRLVDSGNSLPRECTIPILDLLGEVESWEAQLHLLQLFAELRLGDHRLSAKRVAHLQQHLEIGVAGSRTLIRTWSLNAIAVLADQHPKSRARAIEILRDAQLNLTAGSVLARLRHLSKAYPWLKEAIV